MTDFRPGDKIVYIKKCHDHEHNKHILFIGEVYTIREVNSVDVYLAEAHWWVQKDCCMLADEAIKDPEQLRLKRIYNKIEHLDTKFKEKQKAKSLEKSKQKVKSFQDSYEEWLALNREYIIALSGRDTTGSSSTVTYSGG